MDALLENVDQAKDKIVKLKALLESSANLDASVQQGYDTAFKLAEQLSSRRRDMKASFKFVVMNQLKQLGMVNVKFDVEFSDIDVLTKHGIDLLEFKFSGNPNMPLNSLKRVSGGELSRVMLALIYGPSSCFKSAAFNFG